VPVGGDSEAVWANVHEVVRAHLGAAGLSHLEPLGVEYVEALRSARVLRTLANEHPFSALKSGRVVIHPGFEAADRDSRRAVQLAKTLELNKPAKAGAVDPFATVDGGVVDIGSRRRRGGGAKRP
jgi:hypothetical protein